MIAETLGFSLPKYDADWDLSLAAEVSALVAYLQQRGLLTANGTVPPLPLLPASRPPGTRLDGEIDRRTLRTSRPRRHEVTRAAVAVSRRLPPRSNHPRGVGTILVTLECGHTIRKPATQGNPQVGRRYVCPACSAPKGAGKAKQ